MQTVDVIYPEAATADAQIKVLDPISDLPAAQMQSASPQTTLTLCRLTLEEAMDAGIKVSCLRLQAPNKDSRHGIR